MTDRRALVAAAFERDAQVVMRQRVVVIVGERGLVVDDRFVDLARLEQEVSHADQRRRVLRIGGQRVDEGLVRGFAVPASNGRDTALVNGRSGTLQPRRPFPSAGQPAEEPPHEEHVNTLLSLDVVTLFPEMFAPFIGLSILGRAVERGLVEVRLHHILDALEPGERADDTAYGGGPGMVLRLAPIARILDGILAESPQERRAIVLTAPAGRRFVQADAERLASLDRVVIICGHYEGIDDRLRALYPLEELSLGDFVMTGGEIAALAFLDATARLIPGALNAESLVDESFTVGSLDYPSFTRPPTFRGVDVPEVLLSGDHRKIAEWRREQARARTAARRPDL